MGLYLTQHRATADAIKALAESSTDRREAVGNALESVGGKLHGYYFAFGDSDIIIIYEAPDHQAAVSVIAASILGGASYDLKTTVLMSYEEGIEALRSASNVAYLPPSSS